MTVWEAAITTGSTRVTTSHSPTTMIRSECIGVTYARLER